MTLTVTPFSEDKLQLLKDTTCKGSTNQEFELFVHACQRTGLDPFVKQIHAVKRYDSQLKRESMTIQVGIDGYRLIAERTGRYAPGRDTVYEYRDSSLFSATAYVKKQTNDGTWHEFSATAIFTEYAGYFKDKDTQQMKLNNMWATKGHIMLGKCAEACALRKGFPAELSGIYTKEEMEQADNPKGMEVEVVEIVPYLASRDDIDIEHFATHFNIAEVEKVKEYLIKHATYYKNAMPDTIRYYMDAPSKFHSAYQGWLAKNTTT